MPDASMPSTPIGSQTEHRRGLTMYSTRWCGCCHRLRSQLDREGIDYDVVDIEQVPEAAAVVERVNNGNQTVPTLVYEDGTAQTNPSTAEVKAKIATLN